MGKSNVGLLTTYDQSIGLVALIKRGLGPNNDGNFNPDITQARFPLQGADIRTVHLRVEPFRNNETSEQAANRLMAAGHILADTGDLAGFLYDHPQEVAKFAWVVALAKSARWADPDGHVCVPYACVDGSYRRFILGSFRFQFRSAYGVLVRCE
ncbi:MAG: hypothetical protein AAB673_01495 [Patescibacteria group bacterium]